MPETETMSTPTDYNRVLQESIRRKDQVRQLRAELEAIKAEIATLKQERDEYADALVSLGDEYEQLQATANAEPNELQARITELEKEILTRDRGQEFSKLAKEAGVTDAHTEAAIKLMGWKPDADDHDPAKLTEGLKALVGQYAFLKGDAAQANPTAPASGGGATQTTRTTPRPPGPGAYRGALPTPAKSVDEQLAERYPDPSRLA